MLYSLLEVGVKAGICHLLSSKTRSSQQAISSALTSSLPLPTTLHVRINSRGCVVATSCNKGWSLPLGLFAGLERVCSSELQRLPNYLYSFGLLVLPNSVLERLLSS